MSDGATALLIVGIGVGGYALWKLMKREGHGGRHLAGAPCGPTEFWDESSKTCLPVSIPQVPTGPAPQCPQGYFWDYLRQACVSTAPSPRTGWHYAGELPPIPPGTPMPTVDCPPGMAWDASRGYCLPTQTQTLPPPVHHAGWGY